MLGAAPTARATVTVAEFRARKADTVSIGGRGPRGHSSGPGRQSLRVQSEQRHRNPETSTTRPVSAELPSNAPRPQAPVRQSASRRSPVTWVTSAIPRRVRTRRSLATAPAMSNDWRDPRPVCARCLPCIGLPADAFHTPAVASCPGAIEAGRFDCAKSALISWNVAALLRSDENRPNVPLH